MSKAVKSIVIAGNGTNCEREVANACRVAGAGTATAIAHCVDVSTLLISSVKRFDERFYFAVVQFV